LVPSALIAALVDLIRVSQQFPGAATGSCQSLTVPSSEVDTSCCPAGLNDNEVTVPPCAPI